VNDAALARLRTLDGLVCRRAEEAFRGASIVAVLRAASRLGGGALTLATLLLLLLAHAGGVGLRYSLASLVALAVQSALKRHYARLRPCLTAGGPAQRAPMPDDGSFPSGHSLHAVLAAAVVSSLFPPLALLYVPVAVLVAVSRVALGLHYPSDVVAGGVLGGLLAALVVMVRAV
jgi:undecaprenyl-diphosphatase